MCLPELANLARLSILEKLVDIFCVLTKNLETNLETKRLHPEVFDSNETLLLRS